MRRATCGFGRLDGGRVGDGGTCARLERSILSVGLLLVAASLAGDSSLGQTNPCEPPPTCPPLTLPRNVGGAWLGPFLDVVPSSTSIPPSSFFNGEIGHVAQLPPHFPNGANHYTGKVFFICSRVCDGSETRVFSWDPAQPATQAQTILVGNPPGEDFFCSGHGFAPNGDLLVFGGTNQTPSICSTGVWGSIAVWMWDADQTTWIKVADMAAPRWYPGVVELADGDLVAFGHTSRPQVGDPGYPNWDPSMTFQTFDVQTYSLLGQTIICDTTSLGGCVGSPAFREVEDYGWVFLTRQGLLFYAGPLSFEFPLGSQLYYKLYSGLCAGGCAPPAGVPLSEYWVRDSQTANPFSVRSYGSAVQMFFWDTSTNQHREEIYVIGGDTNPGAAPAEASCSFTGTSATVERITNPAPGVNFVARQSMASSRRYANATPLPDGKVLVVGGKGPNGPPPTACVPRYVPELYDPTTDTWSPMNTQCHPRGYHSVGGVLLDGSVVSAGGLPYSCWCTGTGGTSGCPTDPCSPTCSPFFTQTAAHSAEVFEPPYLFDSSGHYAVRPEITFSPTDVNYYSVGSPRFGIDVKIASSSSGDQIKMVSLLRPASGTHHTGGFAQRFVQLNIEATTVSGTTQNLRVRKPENANVCPPGWYMLYVVTNNGVVSQGKWLNIHA